ncbi:MAG TPA: hypothetical protein VFE25_08815 [Opitutaceae bacterium]|jgi:hypothetical protein|nr:hypothetical protein [Opitutaceae bacterium]
MSSNSEKEHKVIITGTGRAGTTFLVRLLTELGLETGISRKNWNKKFFPTCNAGLEHDLLDPETPYIVKNPALCETLPAALATGRFVIDHVYVPIRELENAAASRARNGGEYGNVPGGLIGTADPAHQRAVLAEYFHKLIHVLVVHEIPHTFILFPRLVTDPGYTFDRLSYVLKNVTREEFDVVFHRIADKSLVHDFKQGAKAPEATTPLKDTAAQGRFSGLFGMMDGLRSKKTV